MRQQVLTVHGIATTGRWQEELVEAYAPHFECISIKYPHYRRLGVPKLLLEPWILMPALTALGALWLLDAGEFRGFGWLFTWPVSLLLGAAAYVATYRRRTLSFNVVVTKASPYARPGNQDRTHLIAHSFGTYLIARVLQKRAGVRLGRIVLVGCVLPRAFPWATLHKTSGTGPKFFEIRNELARRDYVVCSAWLMSWLIQGLGIAGFCGFKGGPPLIHDLADPDVACAGCRTGVAPIHNVVSKYLGHSDTFVGSGYAETFWLPFLWGIEPTEYQDFLNHCNAAGGLEREWSKRTREKGYVDPRLVEIETELRAKTWRWTAGTFDSFVRDEVKSRFPVTHKSFEDFVSLAIRGAWSSVILAMEAHEARADRARKQLPPDSKADEAIAWLNPHLAVRRAVTLLPD